MWSLVEHGRRRDDPSFSLTEFSTPERFALDDPEGWAIGNPALGDFLAADGMWATYATTRPEVFAQLRLGRWVKGTSSWLPWGSWAACSDAAVHVPDGAPVVLAFDGSASGDSTALVGCTVGSQPHVWVEGLWEAPSDPRWRVPRAEVAAAVATAFARYRVVECACDPFGWRSEIENWSQQWPGRVIEWPTSVPSRMGPATDRTYSLVATRALSHDGDSRLAAHIEHCTVKSSTYGDLVVKAKERSVAKIDAAVAMIIAVDRAAYHARKPVKRSRVLVK